MIDYIKCDQCVRSYVAPKNIAEWEALRLLLIQDGWVVVEKQGYEGQQKYAIFCPEHVHCLQNGWFTWKQIFPPERTECSRADMARAWAEGVTWMDGDDDDIEHWLTHVGNPYADHTPAIHTVQDPPVDADKPATSKERVLTEAERIIVADLLDEDADTGYRAAMTTTEAVTVTPEDMRRLADEIRHGRVTVTEVES